MVKARDIMTTDAQCIDETATLTQAAEKLRELDVGAMPICGEDDRLKGMITDRDIVVKCLAVGKDPNTMTAGEIGDGKPVTIGADDSITEAIATMKEHQIRRLPVIDNYQLIGMIAQADIARSISDEQVGDLVELISY